MWQLVDESDFIGNPPISHFAFKEFKHLVTRNFCAFSLDADQQRPLIPFRMGDADHGGLGNIGVTDSDVFKLD